MRDFSTWLVLLCIPLILWGLVGAEYIDKVVFVVMSSIFSVSAYFIYDGQKGLSMALLFFGSISAFVITFFSLELVIGVVILSLLYLSRFWFLAAPFLVLPSFTPLYLERVYKSQSMLFHILGGGIFLGMIYFASTSLSVTPFELGGVGGSLVLAVLIACTGFFYLSSRPLRGILYVSLSTLYFFGIGSWLLFPSFIFLAGLELGRFSYECASFRSSVVINSISVVLLVFLTSATITILDINTMLEEDSESYGSLQVSPVFYERYSVLLSDKDVVVTSNVSSEASLMIDPYNDDTNVTTTVLRNTRRGVLQMEKQRSYGTIYVPRDVQR